jgi:hypothetical protein
VPALDYELDTELVNRYDRQSGLLIIGVTYIDVSSAKRLQLLSPSSYASER